MSYSKRSKRVQIVRVSSEFLASLLMQHVRRQVIVICGLPFDARLIGVNDKIHFNTGEVALMFESESWPEVPEGHAAPEFQLKCVTIDMQSILNRPEEYLKEPG